MGAIFRFLQKILSNKIDDNIIIVPFERNELCFCDSGLKYKKCHALKLEQHNKIACRLLNKKTKDVKIKIFKNNQIKIDTNLKWVDIGVGSTSMID